MKQYLLLLLIVMSSTIQAQDQYTLKNLAINDKLSQYGVVYVKDSIVFFSRYKVNSFGSVERNSGNQQIFTLYQGVMNQDGEITNAKEFVSSDRFVFNSSSAGFSKDGKYIYVTTNEKKRGDVYKYDDKTRNLRMELGEYVEGKGYMKFKPLPFCDERYSYAHPSVSPDGQYLYFTSNIPLAKGPTDIFRVKILGNNRYGDIENIGAHVNSPRKEMFPFITEGNVLYFSSDRNKGYGGLDLYRVEMKADGTFGDPVLMPKPINSEADDMCFELLPDGKSGFFSSNREGGKGEDDIYYFTKD
ncbi:TolB family protein [Psychroserpens sp. XS_ASV72]|uniref:TolB family protein n=1 Tax=Psychroserpens sp. XS_ASV72 TaxID=3241293 RepID=UPI003511048B